MVCLGSLYYCSPDEVIFLSTRDAYEPHYVDDRKYFEFESGRRQPEHWNRPNAVGSRRIRPVAGVVALSQRE